jgi:hypothetical protein
MGFTIVATPHRYLIYLAEASEEMIQIQEGLSTKGVEPFNNEISQLILNYNFR